MKYETYEIRVTNDQGAIRTYFVPATVPITTASEVASELCKEDGWKIRCVSAEAIYSKVLIIEDPDAPEES